MDWYCSAVIGNHHVTTLLLATLLSYTNLISVSCTFRNVKCKNMSVNIQYFTSALRSQLLDCLFLLFDLAKNAPTYGGETGQGTLFFFSFDNIDVCSLRHNFVPLQNTSLAMQHFANFLSLENVTRCVSKLRITWQKSLKSDSLPERMQGQFFSTLRVCA